MQIRTIHGGFKSRPSSRQWKATLPRELRKPGSYTAPHHSRETEHVSPTALESMKSHGYRSNGFSDARVNREREEDAFVEAMTRRGKKTLR